jgi:hypothetical protein
VWRQLLPRHLLAPYYYYLFIIKVFNKVEQKSLVEIDNNKIARENEYLIEE